MTTTRRTLKKLERLELTAAEIPPPVEEAFEWLDAIDRHHPETRGCHPGSLIQPSSRADFGSSFYEH
jgi:hypothetical protein